MIGNFLKRKSVKRVILILSILLLLNMKKIVCFYYDCRYTDIDQTAMFIFNTNRAEDRLALMKAKGLLNGFPQEYRECALERIYDSCPYEEAKVYEALLFGGFDMDEYMKTHKHYDDFYNMIMKMDKLLPKYEEITADGDIYVIEFSSWEVFGGWMCEELYDYANGDIEIRLHKE